jgi:hypothetical protein
VLVLMATNVVLAVVKAVASFPQGADLIPRVLGAAIMWIIMHFRVDSSAGLMSVTFTPVGVSLWALR